MMCFSKSAFDQNIIMINHKPNDNFKNYITLREIQKGLLTLLEHTLSSNSKKMLEGVKCKMLLIFVNAF
jgi:hypothetical protein